MKQIFGFVFLIGLAAAGFAQSKTITNADLEKHRQKRLAAEKELRENYREMGFPSPEEIAKQNAEDSRALSEGSERYKQRQLERARQAQTRSDSTVVYFYSQNRGRVYSGYLLNGYYPSYYRNSYRKRYRQNRYRTRRRGPGYISNPLVRGAWLRNSAPMRRTYRGNFKTNRSRVRW